MPLDLKAPTDDGLGRAQRRLFVLQQLTAALARARTYQGIASVIIDEAMPALKAEVGVVALVSEDRRTLRNVGFKGVDAATEDAWQSYPVEAPVPVAEAARNGKPIIVRTIEERNTRYPVLAQVHGLEHGGPVTAFPLFVDDRLLGVLAFCWGGPLDLDNDDLAFLTTLADQCGLAIERARLYELAEREIQERKASEDKLREANARKDEFLAMLAHELRNPLAPIRSAADILTTMELDPPLARLRQVLARQADHMTRIVDDLLDVSRISRDRLALELEIVDLVALVRATTSDHSPSFVTAGIELAVQLGDAPVWVRADVTRLSQALANLLHNAHKFTPRGKTVWVSLERNAATDHAVLQVRDEGVGIEADLLPHLFEPFSQAERSLARTSGGLGLGLALVDGLVRLHGGQVSAASQGRGQGATFQIVLPAMPIAATGASIASPPPPSEPKCVLIVEDNPDAAEMLGAVVETLGHEVRVAHAANAALAILDEWTAHVILSDLGLPGLDGYAFARLVRSRPSPQRPLLVAISGYGNPADKERARHAGFDHHITKPANASMLARLIGEVRIAGS
ncbi:MAG: ATP-binding protein [Kofleriaceae bacterium]